MYDRGRGFHNWWLCECLEMFSVENEMALLHYGGFQFVSKETTGGGSIRRGYDTIARRTYIR